MTLTKILPIMVQIDKNKYFILANIGKQCSRAVPKALLGLIHNCSMPHGPSLKSYIGHEKQSF